MSKHGTLELHDREETVAIDFAAVLKQVPSDSGFNPITDYFEVADKLKAKIVGAGGATDAEMLGLLTIGVISAVEFYLRNVFGAVPAICPIARRHVEMTPIHAGATEFYKDSSMPHLLSGFDGESLADGKRIRAASEKFCGIKLSDDASVNKVIDDFDRMCELRHCLIHSRGYVGLKASNALRLSSRSPHKILMDRAQVFEVLKISHNVVRGVNRFVAEQVADRWVDQGVLSGNWAEDKLAFTAFFRFFCMQGKDRYGGVAYRAYQSYGKAARARASALMARV